MLFKASAPGSLMLLGEYAVLHGKQALACAIDKRIRVTLQPRDDNKLTLSSAVGNYSADINQLVIEAPFQFVLTAIKRLQKELNIGFDLTIKSEFSHQVGFASSAAVTVATLAVLTKWLNISWDKFKLIHEARAVVQAVQGLGSGADVAACVLGSVVAYKMEPFFAQTLTAGFPITVVYSGKKTPTTEAVKQVYATFSGREALFQKICDEIDGYAAASVGYIKRRSYLELGSAMNRQQHCMDQLGVNTPELTEIIEKLRQERSILGAKISGAGLGDCVIALGTCEQPLEFYHPAIETLPVAISARGVECE